MESPMAYRGGAQVANMEFFQFHPTCLYHPQAKSFLISEALRGEGARLLSASGASFMSEYHQDGELAPRDIVARAIDDHMKRTGSDCVYLDISHHDPEFLEERFPTISKRTKELGFDISKQAIPVVPAAHYCCGGVLTDLQGRSSLKRLFAAGEVACTGLHGANRLASNSLLEAMVLSHCAAKESLEQREKIGQVAEVPEWDYVDSVKSKEEVFVSHSWDEVRRLMWNLVRELYAMIRRLTLAKRRIDSIEKEVRDYYWRYRINSDLIELRNIILVADLIIRSAMTRRESRGLHFNYRLPGKR